MFKFFFVILSFLNSQNAASANPSSEQLWNSLQFVHLTDYLKNGTVVPGGARKVPIFMYDKYKGLPLDLKNQLPFHMQYSTTSGPIVFNTKNFFPTIRLTTHWSVMEPVRDLPDFKENLRKVVCKWSDRKIGIVEGAVHFKDQLYGGMFSDMIVVGPHVLSSDAYIFAPKSMKEKMIAWNPEFKGHFFFYNESSATLQKVIQEFFEFQILNKQWVDFKWMKDSSQYNTDDILEGLQYFESKNYILGTSDLGPELKSRGRKWHKTVERFQKGGSYLELEETLETDFNNRTFLNYLSLHPDSGTINIEGIRILAKDYFNAWIQEGIYWGSHGSSHWSKMEKLLELEVAAFTLFSLATLLDQTENKMLGLKPTSLDQSSPILAKELRRSVINKERTQKLGSFWQEAKILQKEIQRLSPSVQKFFKNYLKEMKLWDEKLRKFVDGTYEFE